MMVNANNKSNYYTLLKHPKWQKKRLEVLQAAGFECVCCGGKDKTLHVHHKYYKKGLKPWEYSDCSLLCLCEECHILYQNQKEKLNWIVGFLDFADIEQLLGFSKGLILQEFHDWEMDMNSQEEVYGLALCWNVDVKRILSSIEREKITGYKLKYFKETRHLDGK